MADESDATLASAQLAIEREKLELEKARFRLESRFVSRNLPVIIAAVVSIAGALISGIQLYTAVRSANQASKAQAAQSERDWSLKVATFMSDNRALLLSREPEQAKLARAAVEASLPLRIRLEVVRALGARPDSVPTTAIWRDATSQAVSRMQEDLRIQLKGFHPDHSHQATMTGAHRILKRLQCTQERLLGPDYVTAVREDGLAVAVFVGTYGHANEYGIRFGTPDRGRSYFGDNETYFEYP